MNFWRKGFVHFLSIVLLVSLVGGAYAASFDLTLAHEDKVEKWLVDSKLYDAFINTALKEAKQAQEPSRTVTVAFDNPAVKQSAQQAYPPEQMKKDVHTFLSGNYAWLEGKAAKPNFVVDFTAVQERFANSIGQQVEDRLKGLPVCTPQQLADLQANPNSIDPMTIACRPANLDPTTEAALTSQQIKGNSGFLNNTIITPTSVHKNGIDTQAGTQPYYQDLSYVPTAYQWGKKLPWLALVLSILSVIGILLLTDRKRRALKQLAVTSLIAGIILLLGKFLADILFNWVEKKSFNQSENGELQQALVRFLHMAEQALVRVDLWFGVAFVLIAAAIFITLRANRGQGTDAVADVGKTPATGYDKSTTQQIQSAAKKPRLVQ